uniref:Uncharacterized protein n=1 Tax=Tanacetum cinerariifolium TaxID=118510 RepID=A0A699K5C0_TANCI|nr:hypothetical protein [Tanacetum cinerariifolium]
MMNLSLLLSPRLLLLLKVPDSSPKLRSKKDFYISHANGSGDRVDTQSKVLDEQVQKTSGIDKGAGTILGVPDVPPYESKSDKDAWGDSEDEDENDDEGDNDDDGENDDDAKSDDHDDAKEDVDEGVRTPSDDEFTNKEKLDDEETIDDEEDDEVLKELYKDVNVNLRKDDAEMIDANQRCPEQLNVSQESGFEQEEEDAHVTLTLISEA